jgi:hypothetical protein
MGRRIGGGGLAPALPLGSAPVHLHDFVISMDCIQKCSQIFQKKGRGMKLGNALNFMCRYAWSLHWCFVLVIAVYCCCRKLQLLKLVCRRRISIYHVLPAQYQMSAVFSANVSTSTLASHVSFRFCKCIRWSCEVIEPIP